MGVMDTVTFMKNNGRRCFYSKPPDECEDLLEIAMELVVEKSVFAQAAKQCKKEKITFSEFMSNLLDNWAEKD